MKPMGKLKKRWTMLRSRGSVAEYARNIGVRVGENVRFFGQPEFGSEPYLISIGSHVTISSGVTFVTHEGGHWVLKGLDPERFNDSFGYGRIVVGDNVFIGYGTTILRGVTVGENTVIGACSLVNHSCEPNSVYAGVPARRICSIEEWGEKFLAEMPDYDKENYKKNKQEEVLRIVDKFPKR